MSYTRKVTDFFKPFTKSRLRESATVTQNEEVLPAPSEDDDVDIAPSQELGSPAPAAGQSCNDEEDSNQPTSELSEPPSSQPTEGETPVAAKRLRVIKSSDDEEEEPNSDSSLDDLDELISQAKRASSTAGSDGSRHQASRVENRKVGQRTSTKYFSPAAPNYKFSMATLVAQAEQHSASETRIAKAEAALRKNAGQHLDSETQRGEVEKSLLGVVLGGDEAQSGIQKVMHAMKRTEALSRPMAWYLFDAGATVPPSCNRDFPEDCLAGSGWESLLAGDNSQPFCDKSQRLTHGVRSYR
jgi:hypothetical protein